MARTTKEKPLFALERSTRREHAARFVGELVELDEDFHRDGNVETHRGTVLAVAVPNLNGVADLVVLEGPAGYFPRAFSLATVREIRRVR